MVSPSSSTGDLAESEIEVEEDMNEILLAQQCMLLEGGLTNHLEEIHIYKATADPDTLYYHKVMKEPDADRFRKAMAKEWDDQDNNNNFTITPSLMYPRVSQYFLQCGK